MLPRSVSGAIEQAREAFETSRIAAKQLYLTQTCSQQNAYFLPLHMLDTYGEHELSRDLIRGMTIYFNPCDDAQWHNIVEGVRNADPRIMAFRQLDDRKSANDFLFRKDGARVAVSYKHISFDKRKELQLRRRHTATDRQMEILRYLLKREMLAMQKHAVSIWFDQVHSENKREGSYGWLTCGFLPYATFTVCYLPGAADVDSSPDADVNRVWTRAEHTLGTFCGGIITTGDFEAPRLWNIKSPLEQSIEDGEGNKFRRVLGMGNDGVNSLRRLAGFYLGGKFNPSYISYAEDYEKMIDWAYKLAGLAWPRPCVKFLVDPSSFDSINHRLADIFFISLDQRRREMHPLQNLKQDSSPWKPMETRNPC